MDTDLEPARLHVFVMQARAIELKPEGKWFHKRIKVWANNAYESRQIGARLIEAIFNPRFYRGHQLGKPRKKS